MLRACAMSLFQRPCFQMCVRHPAKSYSFDLFHQPFAEQRQITVDQLIYIYIVKNHVWTPDGKGTGLLSW